MNTLEFDSLYLEFGMHRILSSVYVKCEAGRIVGLLGRNGSGKTSLMKIVFGVMGCEHKSVRFNNRALLGNYVEDKIISYLPQEGLIPRFLKLKQAVELFDVDVARIEAAFPELSDVVDRKPGQLSSGQLRLFEVLLVLYAHHPFCILDEPFSGLMPVHIQRLSEVLQIEKANKGIIITDHLHRTVRAIADDLYVLANGETYLVNDEAQLVRHGYLNSVL